MHHWKSFVSSWMASYLFKPLENFVLLCAPGIFLQFHGRASYFKCNNHLFCTSFYLFFPFWVSFNTLRGAYPLICLCLWILQETGHQGTIFRMNSLHIEVGFPRNCALLVVASSWSRLKESPVALEKEKKNIKSVLAMHSEWKSNKTFHKFNFEFLWSEKKNSFNAHRWKTDFHNVNNVHNI